MGILIAVAGRNGATGAIAEHLTTSHRPEPAREPAGALPADPRGPAGQDGGFRDRPTIRARGRGTGATAGGSTS